MLYNIDYSLIEDYLHICVEGERPSDPSVVITKSFHTLKNIYDNSKKDNYEKLLIQWEVKGDVNRETMLDILSEIADFKLQKFKSIAIYFADRMNVKKMKFIDQLTDNLRWKIQFFDNLEAAKNWIKSR